MVELRDYQDEISTRAASLLKECGIAYLAMECRTGKTFTAFAAALKYGAKSVLIVSKKKALAGILGDYEAMRPDFRLEAINYESVHKCSGEYDLVILDEAHSIGAFPKPSNRAKLLRKTCARKPVIYLSGTPTPESYSQIYHQFWVSSFSPFRLFTNFYKWAKVYVNVTKVKRNGIDINDYSDAKKEMIDRAAGKYFLDFSQEQAHFDARIEEHVLTAPASQWTANALGMLEKHKVLTWGDSAVLGDTPAKLLTKMHQLSSGTVITESGEHVLTDTSKARFIKEYFNGKKIAIFYVYQTEAELLKRAFPEWTDSPEKFQSDRTGRLVFLGQVRSAREGVRLDSADALVFYNLEYSYLSYEQGRNRLSSKERTSPARIYFICSDCGIEKDILDAVHGKTDFTMSYYKQKTKANG